MFGGLNLGTFPAPKEAAMKMKMQFVLPLCLLVFGAFAHAQITPAQPAQPPQPPAPPQQVDQWHLQHFPFDNPNLPAEQRIDNLLSLMTVYEKIDCLGTRTGVPRLGVPNIGISEGIHGVVQREARWGRKPIATTQFPQPPGMGATWDPALVRQAAGVEGYEARFISQTPEYDRQILLLWGPQSDLGRDPRWGRSEEVYGEDPFFNGTMATAFVRGLEGDNPKYWQAAPLLKHFLANENEDGRNSSSSDFDERLFWEYYSVPFRMAFLGGDAKAVMASYNAWNGTPMAVNPIMRSIVTDKWGVDIISSDGGAVTLLVNPRHLFPNQEAAVVACLKAGINQFLDRYQFEVKAALEDGSLKESDLDEALRRKFRIAIKLGLLDPPEMVPYTTIKDSPLPWDTDRDRAVSEKIALESVVLLKNQDNLLPLDKKKIKSIAVIGPLADVVHWDWYGGTPPYTVTPLQGIRNAVGSDLKVNYAAYDTPDGEVEALKAAAESDVAVVVVGNNPTCGDEGKAWYASPGMAEASPCPAPIPATVAKAAIAKPWTSIRSRSSSRSSSRIPKRWSYSSPVFRTPSTGPKSTFRRFSPWLMPRRTKAPRSPRSSLATTIPAAIWSHLAQVSRSAPAAHGLQYSRRLHLYVLQRRAALSFRLRPQLHHLQNLQPAHQFGTARQG